MFIRIAIFLLVSSALHAAEFVCTVVDPIGSVIPRARVIIHWDSADPGQITDNVGIHNDISGDTDINGRFSVELPPGFYDVFVTATAWTPQAAKIRMKSKSKMHKVKLKLSEMVSRNLD